MSKKLQALLLIVALSLSFNSLNAQSTIIGNGTYISNVYGPMYISSTAGAASRYAYIYDEFLLGSLKHGDSIHSIAFYKEETTSLSGSSSFKMYVRPTFQKDFGSGSIDWNTEINDSGFVKVYDDNPNSLLNGKNGFISFVFDTPLFWDTSFGNNLEILVEYNQPNAQTSNVNWRYDNAATQAGYSSNQTKFTYSVGVPAPSGTLSLSEERKPMVQINYPRYGTEVGVEALYSLGKIPAPLGNPDTVKILLRNAGKDNVAGRKAYLKSYGANNFFDSISFDLDINETKLFSFPIRHITNVGMDTLLAFVEADGLPENDSIENLRQATEFTYSYKNLKQPPAPGGIGFNGGTGDFVAKFISTTAKGINQIQVNFGFGNEPFKIGIWDATGVNGMPGNLIWESDTQTSKPGEFIMPVWPPVIVNGTFFVGVRQIDIYNIAFGYQNETPVRNGTFFETSPTGSSNWSDFSPNAPFRFLIEPRIQADNDITPISFDNPLDTLIFGNFDSIAPAASIKNIGNLDQSIPFETICEIRYFGGQLMYSSSIFDTLPSGETKQIIFDKTFFPTAAGEYTVRIMTKLTTDQFPQNDTLESIIYAGKHTDVGITRSFEPVPSAVYQLNEDTIFTAIRADNFGFNHQIFPIYASIYDSNSNVIWSYSYMADIIGGQSATIPMPDFIPVESGKFIFECFSDLDIDTDRRNDTLRIVFYVGKDNDVAPNFSIEPFNSKKYASETPSIDPVVNIINLGALSQVDRFPVYCSIFDNNENLIYTDTTNIMVFAKDSTNAYFKTFEIPQDGNYKIIYETDLENDQFTPNDTMTIYFSVGLAKDIKMLEIINPEKDSILNLSTLYKPSVSLTNNGYEDITTPFYVYLQSVDSVGNILQILQKNTILNSGDTITIDFDSTFIARPEGEISVIAFSNLSGDEDNSNDTLFQNYNIEKSYDYELIGIVENNENEEVLYMREEYIPKVIIKNNSRLPSSDAYISLTILNQDDEFVYNYVKTANPDIKGGIDTVEFKEYFPIYIGTHKAVASIFQIDDQNPFNDTFAFEFESVIKYDLELTTFVNPSNGDSLDLDKNPSSNVIVKVTNKGDFDATEYIVTIELFDEFGNKMREGSAFVTDTLKAKKNRDIVFSKLLEELDTNYTLPYSLKAKVFYDDDQLLENNELSSEFYLFNSLGIELTDFENFIEISPNPFSNNLTLRLKQNFNTNIELISAEGKTLLTEKLSDNQSYFEINTENFSSGVYYLKFSNEYGTFATKLIKY